MKIVLAYSGGLDTSVILSWLKETYEAELIAFCANIGQEEELKGLEAKARKTGASECYIVDLQEESGGRLIPQAMLPIWNDSQFSPLSLLIGIIALAAAWLATRGLSRSEARALAFDTLRAVVLGLVMTVILGAANAYLGLRAGQKPIVNWKEEVAAAKYPEIRQFYVPQTLSLTPTWTPGAMGTKGRYSSIRRPHA